MIITKKVTTIEKDLYLLNFLEDINANSNQIDYLIGILEREQEIIQQSLAFGDYDGFAPSHLYVEDYILVIQDYNELVNMTDILKNYYEQMTFEDSKGGE